jgi:Fe-S cluster biogenesis protein NfuA
MELKQEEIKISAEILDSERCKFTVDRPVFRAGGSLQFQNRDEAKRLPLAELIFGIEGVTGVLLSGNIVTVAKSSPDDWVAAGREIGKAIRAHLLSEAGTVSSALSEISTDNTLEEQIKMKVQRVLDTQINPGVAGHGGLVSLLDVRGNAIYIKMGGGCQGCGMASVTLKQGIEQSIRHHVPEVGDIFDTTDHASGQNPYYSPSK